MIFTRLLNNLRRDDAGFILSAELVLIATVVMLAMIVGLAELAQSVNNEMSDMAGAVDGMSQDGSWQPVEGEEMAFDQSY